jgi:hypothetical protein
MIASASSDSGWSSEKFSKQEESDQLVEAGCIKVENLFSWISVEALLLAREVPSSSTWRCSSVFRAYRDMTKLDLGRLGIKAVGRPR